MFKIVPLPLIVLIFFVCSEEDIELQQNLIDGNIEKYSLLSISPETALPEPPNYPQGFNKFFHEDSILKTLFVFRIYYNRRDRTDKKNNTLISKTVDTTFSFNFRLSKHIYAREVFEVIKDFKNKSKRELNVEISNYYLREFIFMDGARFLGVLVDYGHERIRYAYAVFHKFNDYYKFEYIYKNLDLAHIGAISFDKIKKLNRNNYYTIGHAKMESYDGIAIHLFPGNRNNRTITLMKCFPPEMAVFHNEKLRYNFDPETNMVHVEKVEIEYDKKNEWYVTEEKSFDLLKIISQF